MKIALNTRTTNIPDTSCLHALNGAAIVRRNRISIANIKDFDWHRFGEHIREEHIQIDATSAYFVEQEDSYKWDDPPNSWLAAVLGEEHSQGHPLNPKSELAVEFGSPCFGHVRFDTSILAAEVPLGHVAGVGDNTVYSLHMINLLGGSASGMIGGNVRYRDKALLNWFQFMPLAKCSIIAEFSYRPAVNCAVCGTRYRPWRMIWVGKPNASISTCVAQDTSGYGHLELNRPVVVSLSQAAELETELKGRGFSLQPIFKHDSDEANTMRNVLQELESISTVRKAGEA